MRRLAGIVVVLAVTMAACGGGDDGPTLSTRNRTELLDRVAAVRSALRAFTPDVARAELSTLRAQVAQLSDRDRISDDQSAAILSAAAAVEADLGLAPTTTTTTTTTTVPVELDKHGKPKKEKKGRDD
jgi:hypothetical protein